MMLAEKGGVCVMLQRQCCTFIQNNTAPDETITKALQGLTTLAEELADSQVHTSLTGWLESWLGKWKDTVLSILTSLIVVAEVFLTAVGCCIIPRVRGLVQRLIETAISKQMPLKPPLYIENVFVLEDTEVDPETEYAR